MSATITTPDITLNEAIVRIRAGLRRRTGRAWSVKRGSGTSYCWIRISAPPACLVDCNMSPADALALADVLGLARVEPRSISIPSSRAYYW